MSTSKILCKSLILYIHIINMYIYLWPLLPSKCDLYNCKIYYYIYCYKSLIWCPPVNLKPEAFSDVPNIFSVAFASVKEALHCTAVVQSQGKSCSVKVNGRLEPITFHIQEGYHRIIFSFLLLCANHFKLLSVIKRPVWWLQWRQLSFSTFLPYPIDRRYLYQPSTLSIEV